jgi:hypothetical protein
MLSTRRARLYQTWTITNDVNHATYALQLTQFDGSKLPRLFMVLRPAEMWPGAQLLLVLPPSPWLIPVLPAAVQLTTTQSAKDAAKIKGSFLSVRTSFAARTSFPWAWSAVAAGAVSVGLGTLVIPI